jgi:hypothetical protein
VVGVVTLVVVLAAVAAAVAVLGPDRWAGRVAGPLVGRARPVHAPAPIDPPNPFLAGAVVAPSSTGPPTRLRIPDLQIDTPLDPLGLDATGALIPPGSFTRAGWYAGGPAPGDTGPAVIAGHVDTKQGPAVFARLSTLRTGATIEVERDGGWLAFRVVGLARFAKSSFPTDDVYGPTPGPELRLVTCGGTFNQRANSYRDNVVVYAVPNW